MDYTFNVGQLIKNLPMSTDLKTVFMLFPTNFFPFTEHGK